MPARARRAGGTGLGPPGAVASLRSDPRAGNPRPRAGLESRLAETETQIPLSHFRSSDDQGELRRLLQEVPHPLFSQSPFPL